MDVSNERNHAKHGDCHSIRLSISKAAQALANITDAQVRKMLGRMADEIRIYERAELRDFLGSILDRIELDPEAATLQVCYRIPLRGVLNVASPGGFMSTAKSSG